MKKRKLTKKQLAKICKDYNLIKLEDIVPYFEQQYNVILGNENSQLTSLKERFAVLKNYYELVEDGLEKILSTIKYNKTLCTSSIKFNGASIGDMSFESQRIKT